MNRIPLHRCPAMTVALLSLATSTLGNPPPNDNCPNAIVISDVDFTGFEGHLNDATVQNCEAESPCDINVDISHSTWYSVTPPGAGQLWVKAYPFGPASMPLVVAMFSGCATPNMLGCNQPATLACDATNGLPNDVASFTHAVLGGQTYLIKLASDDLPDGTVVLEVDFHPFVPNGTCANAVSINSDEFFDERDVTLAQNVNCTNVVPPCLNGETLHHSAWYRYDATEDCTLALETSFSSYSTVLTVFGGCPVYSQFLGCVLPPVVACNVGNPYAAILLPVTAGETYYIRASADDDYQESFVLNFYCNYIPGNDHCGQAMPITSNSFHPPPLLITYTDSYSNEPQEDCETGDDGVSNSVFYTFTALADGTATINTLGSTYDTVLSVFDGCGTMGPNNYVQPNLLACHNNIGGILGLASVINDFQMRAGQSYVIKVAGNDPDVDAGTLDFNFEFTPAPLCVADIAPAGGDGTVNTSDLLALINNWGACGNPFICPADIAPLPNGDGTVNTSDLLAVINSWGPCKQ